MNLRKLGALTVFTLSTSMAWGAANSTWALSGSGTWSVPAHWSPATVPQNIDDIANFLTSISAPSTITQDIGSVSLGTLNIDDVNSYTLTSNPIQFQSSAFTPQLNVTNANGNGAHTINNNLPIGPSNTLTISQSSTLPLIINGNLSGGISSNLVKVGPGTVVLNGTNTYAGTTSITGGRLTLDGSITGTSVDVSSGGILSGTGTSNTPVNVLAQGTLQPGDNSTVGTLTVNAVVSLHNGSTYLVEITPTGSSAINVGQFVVIQPGATLVIDPASGKYPPTINFPIIKTGTGVDGVPFTIVKSTNPLIKTRVIYQPTTVNIMITADPFQTLVPSGNAGAVARCLDIIEPTPSDLENIILELLTITNSSVLENALFQMQPSMFKGFALSQENMTVRMRSNFTKRAQTLQNNACLRHPMTCTPVIQDEDQHIPPATSWGHPLAQQSTCNFFDRGWTLWFDAIGDISRQQNRSHEKGFKTYSGGATIGADYQVLDNFYVGLSGAYSYNNIHWNNHAGAGDIQSIYGNLYATYMYSDFFINTELTGAHNSYFGKRHIDFLSIDRNARHSHSGNEAAAYLSTGGIIQFGNYSFSPWASVDYVYLHQNGFKENGAGCLDLRVKASNSNYLRGELGFNFNGCITRDHSRWIPNFKFGVIREWRFMGDHYRTKISCADCSLLVSGLNPDRTLIAPGVSLTTLLCDDHLGLSIAYDGEFGWHYWDQNINFQFDYSF